MVAKIAHVRLWGEEVGVLADTGMFTFEYVPSWLEKNVQIAPIHMPNSKRIFFFPGLNPETYKGLPGVFADTLPDDFGNAVIDAWLARQGRDIESFTALDRLLYTGTRGMGALEYHPAHRDAPDESSTVELESLLNMAQQVLDRRAGILVDVAEDGALEEILQVGTSAGGARPKAVIAVNQDRSEIRSGQVDAPEGFTHYLLKFDGVVEHRSDQQTFGDPQGFGRMEYAYYLMAREAGIDMEPSELLEEGGRAHFMTRRFDRDGNRKRHYQSLCAMDYADYKRPGQYSYEQLFTLARKLNLPRPDAVQLYRRMVFNVVARNHDDHTKNFGFILDNPKAKWRLAPAFDVAFSYRPGSYWVNSHQLTINGKRDAITRADLLAVARQMREFTREANQIIDEVLETVSNWRAFAEPAGVPEVFASHIQSNLRLDLPRQTDL